MLEIHWVLGKMNLNREIRYCSSVISCLCGWKVVQNLVAARTWGLLPALAIFPQGVMVLCSYLCCMLSKSIFVAEMVVADSCFRGLLLFRVLEMAILLCKLATCPGIFDHCFWPRFQLKPLLSSRMLLSL